MRVEYTIEALRDMGVETISDCAIFGAGPARVQVRAEGGTVVLDDATFPGTELAALASASAPPKLQSGKKNAALGAALDDLS